MQRVASLTPSRVPLARCALEKGGRRVRHSMVVDALLEQVCAEGMMGCKERWWHRARAPSLTPRACAPSLIWCLQGHASQMPRDIEAHEVLAPASGGGGALLLEAARQGNMELLVALLDAGVSCYACDGRANTPMHLAARAGYAELCVTPLYLPPQQRPPPHRARMKLCRTGAPCVTPPSPCT